MDTSNSQHLFSKLLSIVGLLGAVLFFTGWIYRWAYFAYFQLDLTSLNLPAQSFLIIPIQVFLGDIRAIFFTIVVFALTAGAIYITLWLLKGIEKLAEERLEQNNPHLIEAGRRRLSRMAKIHQFLVERNPISLSSFKLLESFLNELVIVAWILGVVFWYAQWRGFEDARRDAYHCTSKLPAVVVIVPVDSNPFASQFKDLDTLPALEKLDRFGVIGDWKLFDDLRRKGLNLNTPQAFPRVWRLLQEGEGWLYLFPAFPPDIAQDQRPPILAIPKGNNQLMILRPEAVSNECTG
jgi:hypothetical protein